MYRALEQAQAEQENSPLAIAAPQDTWSTIVRPKRGRKLGQKDLYRESVVARKRDRVRMSLAVGTK